MVARRLGRRILLREATRDQKNLLCNIRRWVSPAICPGILGFRNHGGVLEVLRMLRGATFRQHVFVIFKRLYVHILAESLDFIRL